MPRRSPSPRRRIRRKLKETRLSASPVLWSMVRYWDIEQATDADRRHLLSLLVPLLDEPMVTTPAVEVERGFMAADWLVRVAAPWCLFVAGMTEDARLLRGLPPLRKNKDLDRTIRAVHDVTSRCRALAQQALAAFSAARFFELSDEATTTTCVALDRAGLEAVRRSARLATQLQPRLARAVLRLVEASYGVVAAAAMRELARGHGQPGWRLAPAYRLRGIVRFVPNLQMSVAYLAHRMSLVPERP